MSARRGFALVAVLIVLVALFALSAPFLSSARNADATSQRLADEAQGRLALDAAARHARAALAVSHASVDRTPAWDDEAELAVDDANRRSFLGGADPRGVMWDVDASDLSGRIDPSSAPPQVFANLLGLVTRLAEPLEEDDQRLVAASTAGLAERGFGWIEGELVGWSRRAGGALEELERGLGHDPDLAGCGPRPSGAHPLGATLVDQTAHALARWRLAAVDAEGLRAYDGPDRFEQACELALAGPLPRAALERLAATTSVHAAARAGARWQRAARILQPVLGGQTCRLLVDDARWFNAGTTVEVQGAQGSERRLVRSARGGVLELATPLELSYDLQDGVVRPLARRAVNLNTASPEVLHALFVNLELVGSSSWITPSEADRLAAAVRAARPLTGFEDFLRRVVLPAAGIELPREQDPEARLLEGAPVLEGAGFLQRADAIALYKNGLNANDADLAFSTMPFCFASRDAYALELRAVVNAPSGAARSVRVRDDQVLVVPQRDLLTLWTRQSELDAQTRLDGEAAGWSSGPENTLRHDPLQRFGRPSEARAHMGPAARTEPVDAASPRVGASFPGRGEDGWVQLAPARVDETDSAEHLRAGRVLHFDDEREEPEGRWLPAEPPRLDPSQAPVSWLDDEGLLAPFTFEGWIRLRGPSPGTRLLDVAGPFSDSDRIALELEADALVLSVLGPAEDHPETVFEERGRVRYALDATGDQPGLPLDTWAHVTLDVRGDRADQMTFLVDGRLVGESSGQTRLAAPLGLADERISVDSTEHFPERCVLAIGRELVEVEVLDDETFSARPHVDGALAGFGGRLARELEFGYDPETNLGEIEKGGVHEEGETVSLYGYSLPLASHAPAGEGRLAAELGAFGVARVTGVTGASPEPIFLALNQAQPTNIGWGMKGAGSKVDGLLLDVADPEAELAEVLAAFPEKGGYAVLLGLYEAQTAPETSEGDTLSTLEIVRYSRRVDNRLVLDRRGDAITELEGPRQAGLARRSAFVFDWSDGVTVDGSPLEADERLDLQTLIVPLSIPAAVSAGGVGFYDSPDESDFVQLTRLGADAALTEWVRYDEVTSEHLVRDDPATLVELRRRAHPSEPRIRAVLDEIDDPKVPAGGGQATAAGWPAAPEADAAAGAAAGGTAATGTPGALDGALWSGRLGAPEDDALPLTRALGSFLRFRGVLGTASHPQPAGTAVLPVFKVVAPLEESGGWPGRLDAVTLFDGDPLQPGFPAIVQHAHRPLDTVEHSWTPGREALSSERGPSALVDEQGFDRSVGYVALQAPLDVPIVPQVDANGPVIGAESRRNARLLLFPSGELPRAVSDVVLGGGALPGAGGVPDALVDEVVFGRPLVASEDGGTQLVLEEALEASADGGSLRVLGDVLRSAHGEATRGAPVAGELPRDAALLRIGGEILCATPGTGGRLGLARGGRGLLGTEPGTHALGVPAAFLSGLRVSLLAGEVGADDAFLPLRDTEGFPPAGLVRIGDELVHYTQVVGGGLTMPRASREPGRHDGRGPGLFRGRFGTLAAGHAEGTPVVLFPFRYADRWAERADAPELASFGLALAQPSALVRQVFWSVEEPAAGGPTLGVLQRARADVPWDAEPLESGPGQPRRADRKAPALEAFLGRLDAEQGIALGFQSDRVEWRVFARHEPGSFDPVDGLSHAWKGTPRLNAFGVDWFAPEVLLGRVER